LGCNSVAVVNKRIYKTWDWFATKFMSGGLLENHIVATWSFGNHLSICLKTEGNKEKPVSRWPVSGPSKYWPLASRSASKGKSQYSQYNKYTTHSTTNAQYNKYPVSAERSKSKDLINSQNPSIRNFQQNKISCLCFCNI
jgi:hypothetical protein